MKKAIGQTVRELKRGVNKKVLKVPGIEQKILDATSNEPWGPHGSLLADIAQASRNHHEYQMIMSVIWKRINDTGKNWRHVYKALTVLEYLVAHGSERVLDDIREHAYQISTLSDFKYIDTSGRDQGNNVRRKSQTLVALVNDKERIKDVREKALANRDKYRSTYSTGGKYRPVYGDRCDAEHSESCYGSRDEDRNRYGRERNSGYRDDDRYDRGGESYNRDRDRYGRDSHEQYGRESYHDDDCQGDRGNDDHFGSGNRNYNRDRARSSDEDTRYASRDGSGGRADDYFQDERRLERNLSEQNVGALHDYEGTIRDTPDSVRGDRDGGVVATHTSKASSPATCKPVSPESTNQGHNEVPDVPASAKHEEADEFDPRGSTSAAPPASSTCQTGFFGDQELDPINYLALIPVTPFTSNIEADLPTNTGYGSTSTSMRQPIEDPFGDSPFEATPQEGFPPQRQHFAPTSFQSTPGSTVGAPPLLAATTKMETSLSFDFGGPLGGLTYAPTVANGQRSTANSYAANGQQSPGMQVGSHVLGAPSTPAGTQPSGPRNMNFSHPVAPANFPTDLLQQPVPLASQAPRTTAWGSSAKTNPPNDKFETKSTVWADTLSRGLVNLNISGVKINPLADIGIDFESINRMEKRKQDKSSAALTTSTVAMGKAMGAGSGIGRAAGNGVAPPSNPMMGTGRGRGIAGGAGMGMGIGYGGSMNQAMGMNQGSLMRPPIRMPAGTGMPGIGSGYNPMMGGMGSYGSQHPYGSGNK